MSDSRVLEGQAGRGALAGIGRSLRSLHAALRAPLYVSSLFLTATSVLNAGSGFIFWLAAARLFRPEDVGLASALISVVSFLLWVTTLGLETMLMRYLADPSSDAPGLTNSSLTIASFTAVGVALAFLAAVPIWSHALTFVQHTSLGVITFVAVTVAGTIGILLDYTFVVLRRSELTFVRAALHATTKLVLLVALASLLGNALGLFASWGIATVISVVAALWVLLPKALPGYRPRLVFGKHISRRMAAFSITNYLGSGLLNAPILLIPIIVVNVLGSTANAYSYVGWGVAGPLAAIAAGASTSLFAEGSHAEESLSSNMARSFKLISLLLVPAVGVVLIGGDKLLLVFGGNYSREATTVLRVVAVSMIPGAVIEIYLGIAKVRRRLKALVLVPAAIAISTLVLSYFLARPLGIVGPALAWAGVQGVVAVAMLPSIVTMFHASRGAGLGLPNRRKASSNGTIG